MIFSTLPLVTTFLLLKKSLKANDFSLISSDQTIRPYHSPDLCFSLHNADKIKFKKCQNDRKIGKSKQWVHSQDGHIFSTDKVGSKCWTVSTSKMILAMACDGSDEQVFEYLQGKIIYVDSVGQKLCLVRTKNGKYLKAQKCSDDWFGQLLDGYHNQTQAEQLNADCEASTDKQLQYFSTDQNTTTHQVNEPFLVGKFSCQPTFDLTCDHKGACQHSNFQNNCHLFEAPSGMCSKKLMDQANGYPSKPIKVAFWNAQILGDTKAGKVGVMRTFIKVFENFDIVCVSELRDADMSGAETFFNDYLNHNQQNTWERAYGERDGNYKASTDNESSTEQTIFFYRKSKVELLKHTTFRDFYDQFYVRGPHAAHFRRISPSLDTSIHDFTLIQMHLSADERAFDQTNHLVEVEHILTNGGQMMSENGDTVGPKIDPNVPDQLYPKNVVFGGDFNLDDPYVGKSIIDDLLLRKDNSYNWLIEDTDDTNVSNTFKAYDRIILNENMSNLVCNVSKSTIEATTENLEFGVLRFEKYYEIVVEEWERENENFSDAERVAAGLDKIERVSDHWPVWFTIY